MTKSLSPLRAIAYALAGYTIWVLGDTCTRFAGKANLPPAQIIVLSSIFTITTIIVVQATKGQMRLLIPKKWKLEIARSLLYVAQSFINVVAFTYFPLAPVYVALFLSPIITAISASFILREKCSIGHGVAILAGFLGIALALNPGNIDFPDANAGAWACLIIFPFSAAANALFLRYMGRWENSESMTLFPQIMRVIAVVPFFYSQFTPMTVPVTLSLAGLGFFAAFGGLLVIAAIKHTPIATIQPFAYTQIISGALIGYLLWHDMPTWNLAAGAIVIILANLYIAHKAHAKTLTPELVA
jgi:drug/metabolite transporter (DMT)-like permease